MNVLRQPSLQQEAEVKEAANKRRATYAKFQQPPRAKVLPSPLSKWNYFKHYFDFSMAAGPALFDWREHIEITPAKDQGQVFSCTSFAVAAAIEIQTMIASGMSSDVAAQHMHTCVVHSGESDLDTIRNYGIEPRRLLDLLVSIGFAYSQPEDDVFLPAQCQAVDIHTTLRGFSEVPLSMVRSQITQGPIVTDMYIWPDFYDYTTRRGSMYIPDMNSGQIQMHSVCVVGYTQQGWIIKNSFGTGWGDGTGFATIKRDTCGLLTSKPPLGEPQRSGFRIEV